MNNKFDQIKFDNTYAKLPKQFYIKIHPRKVETPYQIVFNHALAWELGWNDLELHESEIAEVFSGNHVPAGAEPIAMAYAGHQFGNFVPSLGDGRAVLLGEIIDISGQRRDIHFKGSGKTPFSRGADGLMPLGPALREYIVSEAMYALGIPTTRSLAVVATGENVIREEELPGAVLTRVALSHIRIGTFEYFAARNDIESIRILADYTIARLYPELREASNPYQALLEAVIERQAKLIAQWMCIGFIHGVVNTDNMTLSGETIDYGPCVFMDHYDPMAVFSSIDRLGRYAFGNQGKIAQWNLARFAETLLPLLDANEKDAIQQATESVNNFAELFEDAWYAGIRLKLGLRTEEEQDIGLIGNLLWLMQTQAADFTLTFRTLANIADIPNEIIPDLGDTQEAKDWLSSWKNRLQRQQEVTGGHGAFMRARNPLYIPRNHLVERAIKAALGGDLTEMNKLLAAVQRPYEERSEFELYALAPKPEERISCTFCGT